ncbi:MAG: hypothetical protein A2X56_03305 [Nitrospirae bacterium GWC2_57_13]|nr:MAG: hypothetical protein A2072_04085 [Nitrospirae bacterium GWC1_57_7]OGW29144.1 MAG: hypothetical protein A2X56_03305 [Nitrospirae bacterium GWC2_57_13]OGW45116.1 MAG: hypothetical protein A2X57_02785 [Nitrospirae bacterium GWD2_57_8]
MLAVLLVLALSVLPAPAWGESPGPLPNPDDTTSAIMLFPDDALFPPALADPHRTGRLRIGYTRQEMAGAVSWRPAGPWRLYAEFARGYNLRNENLQKPGRIQSGLEFFSPASLWRGRMGWYAAMDLQSWEERDWRLDSAFQAGLLFRTTSRDWRFGIEHVNGRPPMGEFFRDTERWTSFGLWIDL